MEDWRIGEMDNKPHLLIVDDEPRIVRTLDRLLRPHFHTHLANSGAAALDILRSNRIHVILSDQRMPEMTGVELLEKTKQLSGNTTRVLLTGYSDLSAVVNSVNKGEIFRYITKPWKNDELIETVKLAADISSNLYRTAEREAARGASTVADDDTVPTILALNPQDELKVMLEGLVGRKSRIISASRPQEAMDYLEEHDVSIIVAMPGEKVKEDLEFIKDSKANHPQVLSILIVDKADSSRLIEMINEGQIFRFLCKPFTLGQLKIFLMSAQRYQKRLREHPEQTQRHTVQKAAVREEPDKAAPSLLQRLFSLFRPSRSGT